MHRFIPIALFVHRARAPPAKRSEKGHGDEIVNCSFRLQFYISSFFIYATHQNKKQMSKVKMLLIDSQPGYVLNIFLRFWLISVNVLIENVLIKKVILVDKFECENFT